MNRFWSNVIDSLRFVKPDAIDKDKIKAQLKYDRTVTVEVLDFLYTLNILTIDEYLEFSDKIIKQQKEFIEYQQNIQKQLRSGHN